MNLLIKSGMYKEINRFAFCFIFLLSSLNFSVFAQEDYFANALEEASKKNYTQAIDLLKRRIAADSSTTDAYLRLADFYRYENNPQGGDSFFEALITRHPENPHAYLGLARLHTYDSDWQNVFKNCKLALAQGSTSPYVIDLLVKSALQLKKTDELAKVLRATQKDSQQKHLYDLGYAIWRHQIKNLRKARSTILGYLANRKDFYGNKVLGDIERKTNNFQESNRGYRAALNLNKTDSQYLNIDIFVSMAANFQALNKPDSADFYFKRGLQLARKIAARKEQLEINQAMAVFYRQLGMYQKMADVCHEGLEVAMETNELDDLPGLYYDLGYACEKMADNDRALKYYSLALKEAERAEHTRLSAESFFAMGRIYWARNDIENASEYLNQSIDIAKKAGHSNIQYLSLLKIADIHKSIGEVADAKTAYQKVLRFAQRTQQHSLTETCFVKLSDLYLQPQNTQLKSATFYLNMADALARQTFQLQFAANHRWKQGKIALLENEIERAEVNFLEAIQLGKEAGSYMSIIAGQAGLIRTYMAAGIHESAKAYSDSVLISLNDFSDYCFDEDALEFFDLSEDVFIPAVKAYSNVGDLTKIYETCEQYKATKHKVALSKSKYKIKSDMADAIKWKFDLKNKEIHKKWQTLWRMWNKDQQDNLEAVAKIKSEIDSLHQEKRQQLTNIAQRYPEYEVFSPSAGSLPELQIQLRQLNGTFVHYFMADEATFITVITKNGIQCKRVNVTASYLETLIKQIGPLGDSGSSGSDFIMNPFRLDLAGQVYKLIFEPIEDWITPHSTVIISPDAILSQLPFGALVTNLEELIDNNDFNYARFLIEDFAISYVPYANFLGSLSKGAKNARGALLAFANSTGRPENDNHSSKTHYSNGESHSIADEKYLKTISNPFGRDKTELFLGVAATKERFVKESSNYQIIHLALPQSLDDGSPIYSKLYFSNASRENTLEAHEIFNLHLNADLLVLSSNSNPQNPNAGSLNGFLNAAKFAGVPSVVTRTWEEAGVNSPELFKIFYANLKMGLSKAEALRQAKVEYLTTVNRNPLYWAPYLLHGDPQPMVFQSNSKYWLIYITLVASALFITLVVWQFLKIRKETSREAKSG